MSNEKIDISKYKIVAKNAKETVLQSIPILSVIAIFLFTLFFEILKVDFDLQVIIRPSFWFSMLLSYFILIITFFILVPYFVNMFKCKQEATEIKDEGIKLKKTIRQNKLTEKYRSFVKEEMSKEEKDYFDTLLNNCGDIDKKYLDREWTISKLKQEKNKGILNKYQYKLLKNIKNGSVYFNKFDGEEINYLETESANPNKKYSNNQKAITGQKLAVKIVIMLVISAGLEILLHSLFDQDVILKQSIYKTLLQIFTIVFKYATSVIFAYKTASDNYGEWKRFSMVVITFVYRFIEKENVELKEQ